jgi:Ser/Thr protein kinase RdoA (MazF antagonist)
VTNQASHFHRLALRALEHYRLAEPEVAFIRHNDNITFRVDECAHHAAYLLRIHKPISPNFIGMQQRPDAILSELLWLDALCRDTPLTVQQPICNARDELVTMLDGNGETVPCTLVRWIEGEEFHQEGPNAPTLVERLGTTVALLHDHAAHWRRTETFFRPIYDAAYFHNQLALLAPGVEAGVIEEDDHREIAEVVGVIVASLASIPTGMEHWGLIHNDLQGSNILAWEGEIRPIDFSLCGLSYYLSDLGTTLPSIKRTLRESFLMGYRTCRCVDNADLRMVDGLFLLSRLGAYVFILPNQANHERLRDRIPRFVRNECHAFLCGRPLLFE